MTPPAPLLAQLDFQAPYSWVLIPGLILVIASLFFSIRNRRRRAQTDPSMSATQQIDRNRTLRTMHGDLERIMVEIEQMAKRVGNQLDAKAIRLEKLIDEADLKIAQLNHTSNNAPHTPTHQAEAERSAASGIDQPTRDQ
ncbi:MAG: hypothetical protein AAF823_16245 [Planctomycetota bacterium]